VEVCIFGFVEVVKIPICLFKNKLYVYKSVEPEKSEWELFNEKDQENFVSMISTKFLRVYMLLGNDETVPEEVRETRQLLVIKMRVELWEKQTNRSKLMKNIRELIKGE
jgi:hypothetical protein